MRRYRKPFRKRQTGRCLAIYGVVLLLIVGAVALDRYVIGLVKQYARTSAEWYATRMINEAVTDVLAQTNPQYNNLVQVVRDDEGAVTSVEADVQALNAIKAALSLAVAEQTEQKDAVSVSIPLGTFVGSHLFTGRGPQIHIPISASVSLLTDFDSVLQAAGINQTAHRIVLNIKTTVFLAVPTAYTSVEVETSFIIAESILLGKVPDAYTVVENVDEETIGEIFDYGAGIQN